MKIFVLVPTFMRSSDLRRCLASLERQSYSPNTVCVVHQSVDEEARSVLDGFCPRYRKIVEIVDRPGQVAALNLGLTSFEKSSEELLVIIDDDVELPGDWLERLVRRYRTSPEIDGLGGRDNVDGCDETPSCLTVGKWTWYGGMIGNHHLGIGGIRQVDFLKGCNMSFRRRAIAGVRFCEKLLGSGAQVGNDAEFCSLIASRGFKIYYDSDLVISHFPGSRPASDLRSPLYNRKLYSEAAYNYTHIFLKYRRGGLLRIRFLCWWIFLGTHRIPGLLQCFRFTRPERRVEFGTVMVVWLARLQAYCDFFKRRNRRM